jgi:regulator of nucleoside diphosphate kinase
MKPTPIFSTSDFKLLTKIANNTISSNHAKEVILLKNELNRAVVVKDEEISKTQIQINSNVVVEEMESKQQMKFQIVLPSQTNIQQGKYSVLTPLSVAIIGFNEGDIVEWQLPSGIKKLKIISVHN